MKAVLFSGVPELIMFAAVFALGGDGRFFAVFSAAIIHEAAHVAAAALAGVPLRLCRTGFAGAVLVYDTSCASLGAEAAICAAGPGVGLAVTAIGYAAGVRSYFIAANAALSIFNLLPVSYLDGGGILSSLLEMHLTPDTVWRVMRVMSFLFTLAVWCLSVAALVICEGNMSSMCAAIYLMYRLFSEYSPIN